MVTVSLSHRSTTFVQKDAQLASECSVLEACDHDQHFKVALCRSIGQTNISIRFAVLQTPLSLTRMT